MFLVLVKGFEIVTKCPVLVSLDFGMTLMSRDVVHVAVWDLFEREHASTTPSVVGLKQNSESAAEPQCRDNTTPE
jgi:hypothetical protein